ncbi:hypothetical protein CABS01_17083 [Colletotrichum abscissum]|uniref:uncharacterized protein n=1 Tax=Colletotrichum abscissum TaxID=1671311 RepID=UPI0027D4CA1D|nr:uncharacterized protein CABS01_17083 [Colletotrichum abscissum]KAK1493937.1 hypothetical protein CABS01_17083 [Colletotrichum abscissum]
MASSLDREIADLIKSLDEDAKVTVPRLRQSLQSSKNILLRCVGSRSSPALVRIALTEVQALSHWLGDIRALQSSSSIAQGSSATSWKYGDHHDELLCIWGLELYEGAVGVAAILDVPVQAIGWKTVFRLPSTQSAYRQDKDKKDSHTSNVDITDIEADDGSVDVSHHNGTLGRFEPLYGQWYC